MTNLWWRPTPLAEAIPANVVIACATSVFFMVVFLLTSYASGKVWHDESQIQRHNAGKRSHLLLEGIRILVVGTG